MSKTKKYLIAGILIAVALITGYKVYADYCYTSGGKVTIITFMSPKDYNFNFGTVYNDEYTKAGEPNGNSFSITDSSTMSWYIPSGNWGVSAMMMNTTYWGQYFSTLTVTATFVNSNNGAVGSFTFSLAQPQSPQIVISGVASGHIVVTISGTINPNLTAGQITIPCTTLIEWCPDSQ